MWLQKSTSDKDQRFVWGSTWRYSSVSKDNSFRKPFVASLFHWLTYTNNKKRWYIYTHWQNTSFCLTPYFSSLFSHTHFICKYNSRWKKMTKQSTRQRQCHPARFECARFVLKRTKSITWFHHVIARAQCIVLYSIAIRTSTYSLA